ncbi:YadA-like family protein [Actinobacillus delphinicola]|uniref:Autotransporter adhesin n=1 Tax=Actinobacillus delphinicola TaxID=51161 RepID=A0A448TV74_9PAST|nr:YadA-like family protein [Actinobacillus delphinicola]VEJ09846.1 autotransporter adhesin [Actinobacillus delphinicola]
MNRIFKVIFNKTTQRFVVVSELGKNKSQDKSKNASHSSVSSILQTFALSLIALNVHSALANGVAVGSNSSINTNCYYNNGNRYCTPVTVAQPGTANAYGDGSVAIGQNAQTGNGQQSPGYANYGPTQVSKQYPYTYLSNIAQPNNLVPLATTPPFTDMPPNGYVNNGWHSVAIGNAANSGNRWDITLGSEAQTPFHPGNSNPASYTFQHWTMNNLGQDLKQETTYVVDYGNRTAIGHEAMANGTRGIALGTKAQTGFLGNSIGVVNGGNGYNYIYGVDSIAIGSYAFSVGHLSSIALGTGAFANKTASFGMALGAGTRVDPIGGVALGSFSTADRSALPVNNGNIKGMAQVSAVQVEHSKNIDPTQGQVFGAGSQASLDAIAKTAEYTRGAVSVGGEGEAHTTEQMNGAAPQWFGTPHGAKATFTRQITNVAAGSEDSDAVNVAQLRGVLDLLPTYVHVNDNSTNQPAGNSTTNYGVGNAKAGAKNSYDVAIGVNAITGNVTSNNQKNSAISIGHDVQALGNKSISIGSNAIAAGDLYTGPTYDKDGTHDVNNPTLNGQALAIGDTAHANVADSIAIGTGATTGQSLPLQNKNGQDVNGVQSIAIGSHAKTTDNWGIAMGPGTVATGQSSTAIGTKAFTSQDGALAIGAFAKAKNIDSIAIGTNTEVRTKDGIALGSGSFANRDKGLSGYDISQVNDKGISTDTSPTWKATHAAVSIGDNTEGTVVTRQITGVAAGTQDTDAVNVAQLKKVQTQYKGDNDTVVSRKPSDVLTLAGGATNGVANSIKTTSNANGEVQFQVSDTLNSMKKISFANNNGSITGLKDNLPEGNVQDATHPLPTSLDTHNAATVGDILHSGWNIAQGTTTIGMVKPYSTVSFTDGNGTTASVTKEDNGTVAVKYNAKVDGSTIKVNSAGQLEATGTTNYLHVNSGDSNQPKGNLNTNLGSSNASAGAQSAFDIAVGVNTHTMPTTNGEEGNSIAIGHNATTENKQSIAIGHFAHTKGNDTISLGLFLDQGEGSQSNNSIAIGSGKTSAGGGQITGDSPTDKEGGDLSNAIAIGRDTVASHKNSIAMGTGTASYANDSLAIGSQANVYSNSAIGAIAIGHKAHVESLTTTSDGRQYPRPGFGISKSAIAIGDNVQVMGAPNGIVIGSEASQAFTTKDAIAIGTHALAGSNSPDSEKLNGPIALGSHAVATGLIGKSGYDPATKTSSTNTSAVWQPTLGELSLGSPAQAEVHGTRPELGPDGLQHDVPYTIPAHPEYTRRIKHLAAGVDDTDAVNVAQLKQVISLNNGSWDIGQGESEAKVGTVTTKHQVNFIGKDGTTVEVKQATNGKGNFDVVISSAKNTIKLGNGENTTVDGQGTEKDPYRINVVAPQSQYKGDNNETITRTPNQVLSLTGGATEGVENSIKTIGNSDGSIRFEVAKTLNGMTKITFGEPQKPGDNTASVSIGSDGINAGGKQITNVKSGGDTETNGANIGDVKKAIKPIQDKVAGNTENITQNKGDIAKNKASTEKNAGDINTNKGNITQNKEALDKIGTVKVAGNGGLEINGNTELKKGDVTITLNSKTVAKNLVTTPEAKKELQDGLGDGTNTAGNKGLVNGDTLHTSITNVNNEVTAKGLNFAGDNYNAQNEQTKVHKNLGQMLEFVGGATGNLTDNNIGVNVEGGKIHIQLAKNLTGLDSVQAGNTTINNGGVTVNGDQGQKPITINKNGIDAGDHKITNVGAPTNGSDAANKTYVDQTIDSKEFGLSDNDGTTLSQKLGTTIAVKGAKDGDIITKVTTEPGNSKALTIDLSQKVKNAIAEGQKHTQLTNGDTTTATQITADGENKGKWKVEVNKATISVNNDTGAITQSNDTNKFVDAQSLTTALNRMGFKAKVKNTTTPNDEGQMIHSGGEITFKAGDNMNVTRDGSTFTFATSKTPNFDKVTVGGKTDKNPADKPVVISDKGIDAGNKPIKNVGAPTADGDAVNKGYLNDRTFGLTADDGKTVSHKLDGAIKVTGVHTTENGQAGIGIETATQNGALTIGLTQATKNAIAEGQKHTQLTASDTTTVNQVTDGENKGKWQVNVNKTTISVNNDTGVITQSTDANKFVDAQSLTTTLSSMGFKAKVENATKTNDDGQMIHSGGEITFKAGDNMNVTRNGTTFTFATSKTPNFDKVTVGGKTDKNPADKPVVISDKGIDAGDKQITNVKSGGDTGTNGANINDVNRIVNPIKTQAESNKQTISSLQNNTIQLGADGNTSTNKQTLSKEGGLKFNIVGENGVTTTASGDQVKVSLDKSVVRDVAQQSVKVINGENTTVTVGTDGNVKTYAVNVVTNGQVANDNKGIVTGGTVKKALDNQTIGYSANKAADQNQPQQTVKLSQGLNFTNGTNTTATVAKDGVVTYDIKSVLTGMKSIAGNGAKITLGDNGITLSNDQAGDNVQLHGVANGHDKTDAANVGQLTKVTGTPDQVIVKDNGNAQGHNYQVSLAPAIVKTINDTKAEAGKHSSVTAGNDSVTVDNTTRNSSGGVDYKVSVALGNVDESNTTKAVSGKSVTDALSAQTLGYSANKKADAKAQHTVKLSTGLNFKDGTNTTATVGENGDVTYDIKSALTGINSVAGNGAKITLGDKGITLSNGGADNAPIQIHGVAKGTEPHDAVNVEQLDNIIKSNATILKDGEHTTVTGNGTADTPYKVNVVTGTLGNATSTTVSSKPGKVIVDKTALQNALDKAKKALENVKAQTPQDTQAIQNAQAKVTDAEHALQNADHQIATVGNVAKAINNAGFTLQGDGQNGSLVKPGTTVNLQGKETIVGGKTQRNITVTNDNGTVTFDLAKDLTLGTTTNGKATNDGSIDGLANHLPAVGDKSSASELPKDFDPAQAKQSHQAATVGDVLNAGWYLQGNGNAVDFVKPYDTVNFVNGNGTQVTVKSDDDQKVNTINVDINTDGKTLTTQPIYHDPNTGKDVKVVKGDGKDGTSPDKWYQPNANGTPDKAKEVPAKDVKQVLTTNGTFGLSDNKGETVTAGLNQTVEVIGKDGVDAQVVTVPKQGDKPEHKALQVSLNGNVDVADKGGKGSSITVHGAKEPNTPAGTTGPQAKITVVNGTNGVNGVNGEDGCQGKAGQNGMTRIEYQDGNGTKHEVATLGDGLIFKGDDNQPVVRKLNQTLTIKGDATTADLNKFTTGNIGVIKDPAQNAHGLVIKLAKNLHDIDSLQGSNNGSKITLGDSKNGITFSNGKTDATGDHNVQLHGIATGTAPTDAVNVKQLGETIKANATVLKDGHSTTVTGTGTQDNPYRVNVVTGDINVNDKGAVTGEVSPEQAKMLKDNIENAQKALDKIKQANPADKDAIAKAEKALADAEKAADGAGLNKVATVQNVADAINKSGFTLQGDGANDSLVKPGSTVNLQGKTSTVNGKEQRNITVTNNNGTVTFTLNKDLVLGTVNKDGSVANDGSLGGLANHLPEVNNQTSAHQLPKVTDSHQAATVGDVLNAGWNLQGNGKAVDFVKPYDTVNFVNGTGTTVVTTTNGTTSTIQINSLVHYVDDKGQPLVEHDGKYYPAGSVVGKDGKVYPKDTPLKDGVPTDKNTQPLQPVAPAKATIASPNGSHDPVKLGNIAEGKDPHDAVNVKQLNETIKANATVLKDGHSTTVTGTGTQDNPYRVNVVTGDVTVDQATGKAEVVPQAEAKDLADKLSNAVNDVKAKQAALSDAEKALANATEQDKPAKVAAVNAAKDALAKAQNALDNAQQAYHDKGLDKVATVQGVAKAINQSGFGLSSDTGTTVVHPGDKVKLTGKEPAAEGKVAKDGNITVTQTTDDKGNTIVHFDLNKHLDLSGQKDGKPTYGSVDGLSNHLVANDGNPTAKPATSGALPEGFEPAKVAHQAATVSDVLNAGWNLQGNGKAVDFVKPYDTVNFINGTGTTVVTTTNGKTSTIQINSLMHYVDAKGQPLVEHDGKYYPAGSVVDSNGKVYNNGKPADAVKPSKIGLVSPDNKPIKLGNVAAGKDDHDAVNVGQLKEVEALAGKHSVVENKDGSIEVTPTTKDGQTTYDIKVHFGKVSENNTDKAVTGADVQKALDKKLNTNGDNVSDKSTFGKNVGIDNMSGANADSSKLVQAKAVKQYVDNQLDNHNANIHKDIDNALSHQTITYKANGKVPAGVKPVKLSEGLDFTNGDNTTAEVAPNGVVKVNVNQKLDHMEKATFDKGDGNGTTTVDRNGVNTQNNAGSTQVTGGKVVVKGKADAKGNVPTVTIQNGGISVDNVDGNNPKAVVNVGYLHDQLRGAAAGINNVNNRVNQLNDKVEHYNKDLRAGIAGATAIGFLQQPNQGGASRVSAAIGGYKNQQAIAIGYARTSDNNKLTFKVGASVNTRSALNYGASLGYQW